MPLLINGTSPARYEIKVPRFNFSMLNLKDDGSHAKYYVLND